MSDVWLDILGFDTARIPKGAETEFIWTHAPSSWVAIAAVLLAAAALYIVWWLYRRESGTCPRGVRVLLAAIRIACVLVLALVLMGPALAVTLRRSLEPYVILLLDDSLSMSLRDRYDAAGAERLAAVTGRTAEALTAKHPARAEVVDALLRRDDARFLRRLQAVGRVRVMTFSDRLRLRDAIGLDPEAVPPEAADAALDAGPPKGPPVPPLEPSATATNLAGAIRDALDAVAGSPLAGLVLVSDGQHTSGSDPRAAADAAARRGVPILAVGVGDPRPPQNLRTAEVWAPETVFRGDPFAVQARVQAEGLDRAAVQVELVERRVADDGAETAERIIDRRSVALDPDTQEATVAFRHEPAAEGRFVYTVRVEAGPDELLRSDNEKATTVRVVGQRARVLLIAGSPTWDFRMVRTLLLRDKTIDVSCWLQSLDPDMRQDGNTVIERLPAKPEDLFAYDVVALFDPDPSALDEPWIDLLKRFVGEHAGGLFWVAGPKYTTRFLTSYQTRGMRDLLPVRVGDGTGDVRLFDRPHTRTWPMHFTPDGTEHPLLRFGGDSDAGRSVAAALPGVYWSYPAASAKPGATTLIEHGDPRLKVRDDRRPLLVAGRYGPGRVLYMGFDGSWRWRRLGEKVFDRFWVRAVRYLLEGRLMGGRRRGRLATDRDVYPVGSRIAVTARLYDAAFEPLTEPTVPAVVRTGPDSPPQETMLRQVANRPGHYEGSLIAGRVGATRIEVALPGARGAEPVHLARQVTVEPPRVEFRDPRLNRALLVDLARRSGGRYYEIDEADRIAGDLPDRQETIIVREPPRTLWDTWRLLALLVGLLTVEWAVRKRYRLM
ncbi:MAG: VWA domain-containing protein [Phycisphaerae bacterium]